MEYFRAQLRFPFAAAAGLPHAMNIANLVWGSKLGELGENGGQNRLVAPAVVRRSKGPSYRMIDENSARRRDSAHDVKRGARDQSRGAGSFDDVGYETNGLVAKRSIGHQQCQIHRRIFQLVRDSRSQLIFDFVRAAHAAHKGKMIGRERADDTALG